MCAKGFAFYAQGFYPAVQERTIVVSRASPPDRQISSQSGKLPLSGRVLALNSRPKTSVLERLSLNAQTFQTLLQPRPKRFCIYLAICGKCISNGTFGRKSSPSLSGSGYIRSILDGGSQLRCTVLRCAVLHYIVLHCTTLHCTALQAALQLCSLHHTDSGHRAAGERKNQQWDHCRTSSGSTRSSPIRSCTAVTFLPTPYRLSGSCEAPTMTRTPRDAGRTPGRKRRASFAAHSVPTFLLLPPSSRKLFSVTFPAERHLIVKLREGGNCSRPEKNTS